MGERKGTKALELWCRRMTDGYPGVKIDNMTTSWRDGLGFCAIIHHFRPDLIDFDKLNKDDVYHNNELAFRIAERHLGIPALLEPEDMVECQVPDRLSILTYLSQFYQAFAVSGGSSARIGTKRTQSPPDHGIVSPTSTSPPTKVASLIGAGKIRREPCAECGLPVFIAERLNVGKSLYHRTCFRCARCSSQLTLASYYETENGQFCCEECPDEETQVNFKAPSNVPDGSILLRSMSDEDKSASLQTDAYSTQFEDALEYPDDGSLKRNCTLANIQNSEFASARSEFFRSQVNDSISTSESGNEDDIPPDLPKTEPPKLDYVKDDNDSSVRCDSGFPSSNVNSLSVSLSAHCEQSQNVTKESTGHGSIVKARMKLFENNENVEKSDKKTVPLKNQVKIVSLDELEDFDNVSKHDVDIDLIPLDKAEVSKEHSNNLVTCDDKEKQDYQKDTFDKKENSSKCEVEDNRPVPFKENEQSNSLVYIVDDSDEKLNKDQEAENDSVKTSDSSNLEVKNGQVSEEISVITINDSNEVADGSNKEEESNNKSIITIDDSDQPPKNTTTGNSESINESYVNETEKSTSGGSTHSNNKDQFRVNVSTKNSYPTELNPFGDDEVDEESEKKESLNPFGDCEDDEPATVKPIPSPRLKKKIYPTEEDQEIKGTPEHLATIYTQRISVNPFEDNTVHCVEVKPPQPISRKKKRITAEKISLNPFGSDEEDEGEAFKQPVPTPRASSSLNANYLDVPQPRPRESLGSITAEHRHAFRGSNTSLASSIGSTRKKKAAPRPPIPTALLSRTADDEEGSLTSSPSQSVCHSPRLTPKHRKSKRAPPPPPHQSSTPLPTQRHSNDNVSEQLSPLSPIMTHDLAAHRDENKAKDKTHADETDLDKKAEIEQKNIKDEVNRIKQSMHSNVQSPSSSETNSSTSCPNKSTYGKWKRRKGQAPERPIPQKRTIRSLPISEIRRELDLIEIQQQGLERQGVKLEQIIREKCEGKDNTNPDLMLQLFELVNEKNELFRRQTELMYLKRQQRLDEEHADIEYQIRCLMLEPEANKTDSDKAREEELINRLVEIVERKNEIIECLEMDRVRENQEDDSINSHLNMYTLKREEKYETTKKDEHKKDKKKHKKINKLIQTLHKHHKDKEKLSKYDVDKDVDETECRKSESSEKKKKKKFNLF